MNRIWNLKRGWCAFGVLQETATTLTVHAFIVHAVMARPRTRLKPSLSVPISTYEQHSHSLSLIFPNEPLPPTKPKRRRSPRYSDNRWEVKSGQELDGRRELKNRWKLDGVRVSVLEVRSRKVFDFIIIYVEWTFLHMRNSQNKKYSSTTTHCRWYSQWLRRRKLH